MQKQPDWMIDIISFRVWMSLSLGVFCFVLIFIPLCFGFHCNADKPNREESIDRGSGSIVRNNIRNNHSHSQCDTKFHHTQTHPYVRSPISACSTWTFKCSVVFRVLGSCCCSWSKSLKFSDTSNELETATTITVATASRTNRIFKISINCAFWIGNVCPVIIRKR